MDRRLLIPAFTLTALAQQPDSAAAEAEKALKARAREFFQLQVDKKYRQAESMVAEDSKDLYYNGAKYNIGSFEIKRVELSGDNTRAKVFIVAKVTLVMMGGGAQQFDAPATALWKIENGKWCWYSEPSDVLKTPFGEMKPGKAGDSAPPSLPGMTKMPDAESLQSLVTMAPQGIVLVSGMPPQTVTISNGLPGGIDLKLDAQRIAGVTATLAKTHLESGEKTTLTVLKGNADPGTGVIRVLVSPIALELDLKLAIQ